MKRPKYKRFKRKKDLIRYACERAISRGRARMRKKMAAFGIYQATENLMKEIEG